VESVGEGTAILFVHGLMCDSRMFAHQVTELSRDHHVITMDLRGHGQSDTSSGPFSIRDVSKDLMKVLDALGITRAIFAGHGVGGAAALHVALTDPDRILALIMMNATADEEASGDALKARAFGAALKLAGPRKELLQLVAKSLFSHTCHVAHPDIVEAWIADAVNINAAGVQQAIEMMVRRPSLDQRLERLEMRALAIAGSEDTVTPWALQQRLVDRMPNARMKTIQRAGHLSPIEKPQELTDLLRGFARELSEGVRDDRTGRLIKQA